MDRSRARLRGLRDGNLLTSVSEQPRVKRFTDGVLRSLYSRRNAQSRIALVCLELNVRDLSSDAGSEELAMKPDEECLQDYCENGVRDGREAFRRHVGTNEGTGLVELGCGCFSCL